MLGMENSRAGSPKLSVKLGGMTVTKAPSRLNPSEFELGSVESRAAARALLIARQKNIVHLDFVFRVPRPWLDPTRVHVSKGATRSVQCKQISTLMPAIKSNCPSAW